MRSWPWDESSEWAWASYQMCVEGLVWPWVVREAWAISKNANANAWYRNCLIFWASRCIFTSNSQHIIMFLDWILNFFLMIEVKTKVWIKNILCFFKSPFIQDWIVLFYGHAGYDNCSKFIPHKLMLKLTCISWLRLKWLSDWLIEGVSD